METVFNALKAPFDGDAASKSSPGAVAGAYVALTALLLMALR